MHISRIKSLLFILNMYEENFSQSSEMGQFLEIKLSHLDLGTYLRVLIKTYQP